jgi:hypothetical protein
VGFLALCVVVEIHRFFVAFEIGELFFEGRGVTW